MKKADLGVIIEYEYILNTLKLFLNNYCNNAKFMECYIYLLDKESTIMFKSDGALDEQCFIRNDDFMNAMKSSTNENVNNVVNVNIGDKCYLIDIIPIISARKDNVDFTLIVAYKNEDQYKKVSNTVKPITDTIREIVSLEFISNYMNIAINYQKAIIDAISDGYMVVDNVGIVKFLNKRAYEILGLDETAVGQNLRELTDFEPELFEVIKTGIGWTNKEFIIDMKTKKNIHLLKTAIPVLDNNGEVAFIVDTFKEIDRVKNLVNSITGADSRFTFDDIIYSSVKMDKVISMAKKVAKSDSCILIQGESGTGKELLAHSIHNFSNRNNGPFVTIDCSAIPKDLVESELFGYVKGAFTGARRGGRPGKFEMANGGTIFLDEIGEMSQDIQKRFLRVLQSYSITRIGDYKTIPIDVRVIAATNRNLRHEVMEKNFRSDLFYRINVIKLSIPPLRERPDDILPLATFFIDKLSSSVNKKGIDISERAKKILVEYNWPGNIRELENVIERALNLTKDSVIDVVDLPTNIINESELFYKNDDKDSLTILKQGERDIIIKMLNNCEWNKKETARMLGISRSTLYKKMEEYSIQI